MKKPYLIAEIGINHNGSIDIAKKLIKNAKDCGFDAVKFQKRTIDLSMIKKLLIHLGKVPGAQLQENKN